MKFLQLLTATVVLAFSSLAMLQAAPHKPSPADPKAVFQDIDTRSATVAQLAFEASRIAEGNGESRDAQLETLDAIRENVNRIGGELRFLESEKNSLDAWEVKVLEQTESLMSDAAANTSKAIRIAPANPERIHSGSYINDVTRISKDVSEAASLVSDYLKLSKTQANEHKLEQKLGSEAGF